jgi:hypothetical protein
MTINTNTARDMINDAKANGYVVTVTLVNGDAFTGDAISVNSKGVNIKVDGKVRSFAVSRVDVITVNMKDTTLPTGSPADVAPHFGMTAKELRIVLRTMNMNVGKGHRYDLDADAVRAVAAHLATN